MDIKHNTLNTLNQLLNQCWSIFYDAGPHFVSFWLGSSNHHSQPCIWHLFKCRQGDTVTWTMKSGSCRSPGTWRPLGYERVYLPLYKVVDTPFHRQGDDDLWRVLQYRARLGKIFQLTVMKASFTVPSQLSALSIIMCQ